MSFQTPITIDKTLERVLKHEYVLPAIQREFVWRSDQIARLFDSLMRGYPIGSFLFWKVKGEHCREYVFYDFIREYHQRKAFHLPRLDMATERDITAILDGQQRLTALNIGLRGSHAEKLPRKWVDNPEAYPKRWLCLNIGRTAEENELGMEYDFRFLTKDQMAAQRNADTHWFQVSNIWNFEQLPDIFDYIQEAGLATNKFAFRTLSRLHAVVFTDPVVNYFEEESQDLDKVLNIFIRVNSGGTVLSYSDLLLSIATAQWKDVDAREVIHDLVDDLNDTGQGFNFSKDLVLKAGLMLSDIQSVSFRVTNFNSANMEKLEANWSGIANSLRVTIRLLADFGFSERTLTADSVVIPLAYYLYRIEATESFLRSPSTRRDRDLIRSWVVRSLVKPGVWGSGLDTLLVNLRNVIRDSERTLFPVEDLESGMTRLGKSLRFEEDEVQDLVSTSWSDKRAFPILSLLYPGLDFHNEFHIDHIFPKSRFTRRRLTDVGIAAQDLDYYMDVVNRLPNLQLLEGPVNTSKSAKLPAAWMKDHLPDESARHTYHHRHDLGELSEGIDGFIAFYDARRERMTKRLRELLGTASVWDSQSTAAGE